MGMTYFMVCASSVIGLSDVSILVYGQLQMSVVVTGPVSGLNLQPLWTTRHLPFGGRSERNTSTEFILDELESTFALLLITYFGIDGREFNIRN